MNGLVEDQKIISYSTSFRFFREVFETLGSFVRKGHTEPVGTR